MNTTHSTIAVSNDGDVLISQGPAQPVLFISQHALPFWLHRPDKANAAKITSPFGVALINTMLSVNATVEVLRDSIPPSASQEDLCFSFTLSSGFRAGYFATDLVVRHDRLWLRRHGYNLAISTGGLMIKPQTNEAYCLLPLRAAPPAPLLPATNLSSITAQVLSRFEPNHFKN